LRKVLFILLALCLAGSADEMRKTIAGGVAIAVGDGSDGMNPGPSISFDLNKKIHKNYGLGGHFDYAWLTVKNVLEYNRFSVGLHLFDIGFVPRLYAPIDEKNGFYFEVDPEIHVTYGYININGFEDNEILTKFGLCFGGGAYLSYVTLLLKVKMVFYDEDTDKWISLLIGFPLEG
jgi:hypothetical protein